MKHAKTLENNLLSVNYRFNRLDDSASENSQISAIPKRHMSE